MHNYQGQNVVHPVKAGSCRVCKTSVTAGLTSITHVVGHLWSSFTPETYPGVLESDEVWCDGTQIAPPEPTPEKKANPKTNCMKCGWPRSVKKKNLFDNSGNPIKTGNVFGKDIFDADGVKVAHICSTHCFECCQYKPDCQCCKACGNYPCACNQPTPSLDNSILGSKHPGSHHHEHLAKMEADAVIEQELLAADAMSVSYSYQCKKCSQHFKLCSCPGGPFDEADKPLVGWKEARTNCMPPPWIHRGQKPKLVHTDVDEAWPNIRPKEHDPVEWAADFYLMQALTSGVLNTQHECDQKPCQHRVREIFEMENSPALMEARVRLFQVTEEADRCFTEYIDMACGGELRHHKKVGGTFLNSSRVIAWANWRDVRDLVGLQALLDMAVMFEDIEKGGIGGKKWADAARLLHSRLSGRLNKTTFVDQTFSLVHNGGVFLNKREWKNNRLDALQGILLPAQAQDDYSTLLSYASDDTKEVWYAGLRAMNYARMRARLPPVPIERSAGIYVCSKCGMPKFLGHRVWECRKLEYARRPAKDRGVIAARWAGQWANYAPDMKTLRLSINKIYRCTHVKKDPEAYGFYVTGNILLDSKFTVSPTRRYLAIDDGDYTIFKVPCGKFKDQEWTMRDFLQIHGLHVELVGG